MEQVEAVAPTTMATTPRAPMSAAWLGVVPFFSFAALFLLLPTAYLVAGAFQDSGGNFTLANLAGLWEPGIRSAYLVSVEISAASAVLGAALGFALAWAVVLGGLPRSIRPVLMTFSGVASNFAGLPLAFAFIATLGRTGLVTTLLQTLFGFNLYRTGFNILSFSGLTLTYLYFQVHIMVLILTPALDGLKREWGEAASTLGASTFTYWRLVVIPILWPSLLGTTLLLFANSFGAIATAYGLTGSTLNLVTILLYAQIRGDVLHDPHLGAALALGMVAITGISNALYIVLRTRSERWLR